MAESISFLIIGNGIAGVTAAETLRAGSPDASIGIIAEENQPVYFRPALKDFLAGRVSVEKLWARPEDFYQQQRIHFLPDRVVRIYADKHTVTLESGGRVRYDQLLIASGARATPLDCPGAALDGVLTLRTLDDYQHLQSRLQNARHIVVCGSGPLALETIEALRGRDFRVTHLIRKRQLWSDVLDRTASDLVLQEEQRANVDIRLEREVVCVEGTHGTVRAIVTNEGERIPCDLLIVAIGITPGVEYVRASGIFCRKGVVVDQQFGTSASDVYAAGDIIETSLASGRTRLLGQWYPAVQQARAAAYNMLGLADTARPFRSDTFYNATMLYGLPLAAIGVTVADDYQSRVASPQPLSYRKLLLDGTVPIGFLALGDRRLALACKRAIDGQVDLAPILDDVFRENFDLTGWLDRRGAPALQTDAVRLSRAPSDDDSADGDSADDSSDDDPARLDTHAAKIVPLLPALSSLPALKDTPGRRAWLTHTIDPRIALHIVDVPLDHERPLIIGRQPGQVDLVVNEGSVSRRHARIRYATGRFLLSDLESLNGTFLNGQRLESERQYELKEQDEIRCGNIVTFRFLLRTSLLSAQRRRVQLEDAIPLEHNDPHDKAKNGARTSKDVLDKDVLDQEQHIDTLTKTPTVAPVAPVVSVRGMAQRLPSSLANALERQPALIILPAAVQGKAQPPLVRLLATGARLSVGRVAGNDIVLDDRIVSRRHAEIFATSEGFSIRDLQSSNGVIVNGHQITQPYRLAHGDHITLGTTIIIFIDLQAGHETTSMFRAFPTKPETNGSIQPQPATNRASQAQQPSTIQPPPAHVVICPRCGLANMAVARFCAGCSTPLHTS